MGPFEFFEPQTIDQALSLLAKFGEEARVLAGGTDLIPLLKEKSLKPEYVININRITGLDYIRIDKNGIFIGALTTIRSIEQFSQIKEHCSILYEAASQLASLAIRNVATIGGNLCNASPSADMAPPLLALSASAKIIGLGYERVVPLERYFTSPGVTILKPNELMTEIQIPRIPLKTGGTYIKYTTRGGEELALASVAVLVTMTNGVCTHARIALGAVAPTPIRATKAEGFLIGNLFDENLVIKAAQTASDESAPIDDIRSSAEYRREIIKIITRDAIRKAVEMAAASKN